MYIFHEKNAHQRKPLSSITKNSSLLNKENEMIYSNLPDLFNIKDKKNIIQKQESITKPRRGKIIRKEIKSPASHQSKYQVSSPSSHNPQSKKIFSPIDQLLYPPRTNIQLVPEYLDDIVEYYIELNKNFKITYGYMMFQNDINEKMRAILIDWLVEVNIKFKLTPETLYLTVNIIDKYLSIAKIKRSKLQLVGVTCLFIICKYEEIYPPELKDFADITDNAYTKEEIINMENDVLMKLKFDLTFPTSYRYLEIFYEILNLKNNNLFYFGRYLIELCLIDYKMLKYTNAEIAIGSFIISYKINVKNFNFYQDDFNLYQKKLDMVCQVFGFNDVQLQECIKDICYILDNADNNWLQAVKNKFSSDKYFNVQNWKGDGTNYNNK